jgi:hypothetical protein
LHPGFHGDPITDDDVILNQAVRADITFIANHGTGQYNHELPYPRAPADSVALHIG